MPGFREPTMDEIFDFGNCSESDGDFTAYLQLPVMRYEIPDQLVSLTDMPMDLISLFGTYLSLSDFSKLSRTRRAFHKVEMYNGRNYEHLLGQLVRLLNKQEYGPADPIMANIVKKTGAILFKEDNLFYWFLYNKWDIVQAPILLAQIISLELLDQEYKNMALIEAIGFENNVRVLQLLLKNGADPNYGHSQTWTAFVHDCVVDNLRAAEILFDRGAQVNFFDMQGRNAIRHAIWNDCSLRLAQFLLEAGSDIRAIDLMGYSGLHLAARQGVFNIYLELLDHGIDSTGSTWNHATEGTAVDVLFKYYSDLLGKYLTLIPGERQIYEREILAYLTRRDNRRMQSEQSLKISWR